MYSFETILEGVKYTVYLFASFTGIIQPFTPEYPITAEDIFTGNIVKNSGTNYVQAWYSETRDGPRLDMIKTVHLEAKVFEIEPLPSSSPGTHYYRLYDKGNHVTLGEEMNVMDAVHENNYLRYVVDQEGKLISSLHILIDEYDIHRYKYNERGVLIKRKRDIIKASEALPEF